MIALPAGIKLILFFGFTLLILARIHKSPSRPPIFLGILWIVFLITQIHYTPSIQFSVVDSSGAPLAQIPVLVQASRKSLEFFVDRHELVRQQQFVTSNEGAIKTNFKIYLFNKPRVEEVLINQATIGVFHGPGAFLNNDPEKVNLNFGGERVYVDVSRFDGLDGACVKAWGSCDLKKYQKGMKVVLSPASQRKPYYPYFKIIE